MPTPQLSPLRLTAYALLSLLIIYAAYTLGTVLGKYAYHLYITV